MQVNPSQLPFFVHVLTCSWERGIMWLWRPG